MKISCVETSRHRVQSRLGTCAHCTIGRAARTITSYSFIRADQAGDVLKKVIRNGLSISLSCTLFLGNVNISQSAEQVCDCTDIMAFRMFPKKITAQRLHRMNADRRGVQCPAFLYLMTQLHPGGMERNKRAICHLQTRPLPCCSSTSRTFSHRTHGRACSSENAS